MDYTFQEQSLKVVSYKKNSVAHFDGETCSKLEIILLKQKEPSPVLDKLMPPDPEHHGNLN